MKYNIIFLDIDGVLNSHQFLSRNLNTGINRNIDSNKVELLKEIVEQTEAKIEHGNKDDQFAGTPVTTDTPMLYDQTVYSVYLVRRGDKFSQAELKSVARICNISYPYQLNDGEMTVGGFMKMPQKINR